MITQLSLLPDLPDNELPEPRVRRPSVPVAKLVDGKWCWKCFGSDEYIHEPALEQVLLAAIAAKHQIKKAA